MSESQPQSNNKAVVYRGRADREMPVVSQAQNRFMHAHEHDEGKLGKAAKKFVKASHGMKVKRLPEHVKHAMKRGLVSNKALKRHMDD